MSRKQKLSEELITKAEETANETKDVRELREALSILLPGVLGINLTVVSKLIGRSKATTMRLQRSFKSKCAGNKFEGQNWGGRRHSYLTIQEEGAFLAGFLDSAGKGGFLVVSKIKQAFEAKIGQVVAESTIYRLLDRHDWRKIAPRPGHPKANLEEQERFKKNLLRNW